MAHTARFQAVQAAQPHLSDHEVYELLDRASRQHRDLVVNQGMNFDQATELVNRELFQAPEAPSPLMPNQDRSVTQR